MHMGGVAPSRGRGSKLQKAGAMGLGLQSPPHGGADRNNTILRVRMLAWKSPPHGGADRNILAHPEAGLHKKSPPHGGADRNNRLPTPSAGSWRRPPTGARIENIVLRVTETPQRTP